MAYCCFVYFGIGREVVTYTFGILQSCNITAYDALSNQQFVTQCTYVLGAGDHLITLYELGQEKHLRQYWIKKLDSGEMRWENASPDDGNPAEIKFRREEESFAL